LKLYVVDGFIEIVALVFENMPHIEDKQIYVQNKNKDKTKKQREYLSLSCLSISVSIFAY